MQHLKLIALDFAQDGWDVAVHCNSSIAEAEEVAAQIRALGRNTVIVRGNLSAADVPDRLIAEASAALGGLSWAEHLDTNLRAPVFLSQAFARQLPEGEEGNIISIIDQRVWKLNPKFFSYTTSKSGLWTATRTLAQALAPRIRVNAIGPGPALPSARMDQTEFDKQAKLTLLGRGTSPEEISAAVKFILSQPSLTGQMIALDGGQHLVWQTPDVVEVHE